MTDRRSFIKGLAGIPLALLAGGTVMEGAVTLEEHGDSGLVVPAKNVTPAKDVILYRGPLAENEGYAAYDVNALIPKDGDCWLHVEDMGGMVMTTIMVTAGRGEVYARFIGRHA